MGEPSGGTDRVSALARGLQDRGVDVTLVTPEPSDPVPARLDPVELVHVDPPVATPIVRASAVVRRADRVARERGARLQIEHSTLAGVGTLHGIQDYVLDMHDLAYSRYDHVDTPVAPVLKRVVRALEARAVDRAEHVVRENERVREAAARLREGELDRCGDLLYASHGSLRDLYEVSCDELDAVVGIARETGGVHGARMTGGGFGGSVVCLVAPDAVARLVAAVEREYPDRTGVEPGVYPCAVGRGVDIHRR
jgi:galactokinase